ncbi:MAG: exosortase-associated EpsI family protein [Verrucomicrobiota bacterium]
MRKAFFIIGAIIAVFSCIALGYTAFIYSPPKTMEGVLTEKIVSEFDGWEIEDRPLAESEGLEETVEGILNFSQALNRNYTRGDTTITLYVGYWEPKKMPVRLVQSHTPDVCWVRAGWTMMDKEYDVRCEIGGQELYPAEMRTLEKQNHTQHVAYWHVLGDHIHVNRTKAGQWDRFAPFKTLFRYGLHQQREQFFIRINSNRPIKEIWNSPLMQEILSDLAEVALVPASLESEANT